MSEAPSNPTNFDPRMVTRPDPALLNYYILVSLCSFIAAPFVFIPLYIRYSTMRYTLDDEGISMSYGFFFRREVYLAYRRIQDIHVTRNIVERWLGLAKVPIQTASGTSGPTMQIEGIRDPEPLRDYLYQQMRGARGLDESGPTTDTTEPDAAGTPDDPAALLRDIRDEVRRLREKLEQQA